VCARALPVGTGKRAGAAGGQAGLGAQQRRCINCSINRCYSMHPACQMPLVLHVDQLLLGGTMRVRCRQSQMVPGKAKRLHIPKPNQSKP